MKLYNLKDHNEQVSFAQAVTQGLGKHQGLFFPHDLPEFSLTEIDDMLAQDLSPAAPNFIRLIGDEIPQDILQQRVRAALRSGAGEQGSGGCRLSGAVPWPHAGVQGFRRPLYGADADPYRRR